MRCGVAWGGLIAVFLAWGIPSAWAADAVAHPRRSITELIEQLGDPSFARRESAATLLLAAGETARAALLAGTKHSDVEIQIRCRSILKALDRAEELRKSHRKQARVDRFLEVLERWWAKPDAEQAANMPGYRRFRKLAGDDAAARQMYHYMGQAVPRLLLQYASDPKTAASIMTEMIDDYRNAADRSNGRVYMPLGVVAALYFVASDPKTPVSPEIYVYLGHFGQKFLEVERPFSRPLKAIASSYAKKALAETAILPDTTALRHNYFFILKHNLRDAAPAAQAALQTPEKLAPLTRYLLIMMLGYFHDRGDRPPVDVFLGDQSPCCCLDGVGPGGASIELKVCDAALNVLVLTAKEDLADYGFFVFGARARRALPLPMRIGGFADNKARLRGLQRWRQRH